MARKPQEVPGLRFRMSNESAEQKIEKSVGKLITNLREETKKTVRDTVLEGYKQGKHPNSIALDIAGRVNPTTGKRQGGIVGMSRPQAEAAKNFRSRLESGESAEVRKVLDMKLRDRRFDETLGKVINGEVELTQENIDRMVDRYIDAALELRGETIARTETMSAVSSSSLEAFEQALDKSEFSEKAVIRTWRTSGGDNVRDSHADMEGQTVEGLDEPFISGLGNELMHPGDTSLGAGAEDVINCACDVEIEIDFTENVDKEQTPQEEGEVLPGKVEAEPGHFGNVFMNGKQYKTVATAFRQNDDLPQPKDYRTGITKLREDLLEKGEATIIYGGKEYNFRFVRTKEGPGDTDTPPPPKLPRERTPPPPPRDTPPPADTEVFQPKSNRAEWDTPRKAFEGFRANHGVTLHQVGVDQRAFVAKAKDIDARLTEIKQLHPGVIGMDHLLGGVHVDTGSDRYLKFVQGGKTADANGLYHPFDGKMRLASGLRTNADIPVQRGALVDPSNWVVGTSSVSDVFAHEYGHALEAAFKPPAYKTVHKPVSKDISDSPQYNVQWWETHSKKLDYAGRVSRYAKTNGSEFWAESVAAWTSPRYQMGMLHRDVEEYFLKVFKTRGRTLKEKS